LEVVKALLEREDLDSLFPSYCVSPFFSAFIYGRGEVVELLSKHSKILPHYFFFFGSPFGRERIRKKENLTNTKTKQA